MLRLTIRDAHPDDEGRVIALWRDCGLVSSYNDPAADFRFAMAGLASGVLVGQDEGGRVVASVMVGHDGHRGWLYYVAADPAAQGQGIGRRLIEETRTAAGGALTTTLLLSAPGAVTYYEGIKMPKADNCYLYRRER